MLAHFISYRKENIDLNDAFVNIDAGNEMEATIPVGKSTNDGQGPQMSFTLKPQTVLEVWRKERQGCRLYEKLLRLVDQRASHETVCVLRDDWETMVIYPGDVVQVSGLYCVFTAFQKHFLSN